LTENGDGRGRPEQHQVGVGDGRQRRSLRRHRALQRRGVLPAVGRHRRRVVELHDAIAAGKTVTFTISGGTGDADMYVRAGAAPTTTHLQLPPVHQRQQRDLHVHARPRPTTYYVNVRAYAAYSGVSLKGTSN
jgi:hypothetical protein